MTLLFILQEEIYLLVTLLLLFILQEEIFSSQVRNNIAIYSTYEITLLFIAIKQIIITKGMDCYSYLSNK